VGRQVSRAGTRVVQQKQAPLSDICCLPGTAGIDPIQTSDLHFEHADNANAAIGRATTRAATSAQRVVPCSALEMADTDVLAVARELLQNTTVDTLGTSDKDVILLYHNQTVGEAAQVRLGTRIGTWRTRVPGRAGAGRAAGACADRMAGRSALSRRPLRWQQRAAKHGTTVTARCADRSWPSTASSARRW